MKKIYLLFAFAFSTATLFAQVLFTFGTNAVSKEEFLQAYNKNKTTVADKEKSLREYLDLYSRFKLKTKAASELKLDTLQQLRFDLLNFRTQIEENYMSDQKGIDSLVNEAFERSRKDIHTIHFFVPIDEKDSTKGYKAIQEIYQALQAGETGYVALIKAQTDKGIQAKKGDLGYITALSIPYIYENIIYVLQPGAVSKPFRTITGWHVFKNEAERKSIGKWKVAQILLAFPPNTTPEDKKVIAAKADSLYKRLLAGDNFATMANVYSNDKLSFLRGGELPVFGTGKYESSFENRIIELKNDSDISKPFLTSYG
ncbi:MAG: peptidylprolyl isomerase, partial [Sphingobacteriales bacterium]|nr:peptidylprolyl isomerase [Sphingobacteriales bacterium]